MSQNDCQDCGIEREYSGMEGRPGGYALVYVCPSCGDRAAFEADEDDMRDTLYR